jgi:peptidoglycan/xylan/chitin deacetylase (PgdA/CDA1 family)
MTDLAPGLYVLNYHDVGYECSVLTRGIGYHHSPDVFARHVEAFARAGDLLSTAEAIERLAGDRPFARPTFAFWFDDGFAGVSRFAAPILQEHGVAGAVSICSRFIERTEMYWHCILSCLSACDALKVVRSRLRPLGYDPGTEVKGWLSRNFSGEALSVVHAVYEELVPPLFRQDAFRVFETEAGLRRLVSRGWLVANHTAAHYPASRLHGAGFVREQFAEGTALVEKLFSGPRFLVVPFGSAHVAATPASFYRELGLPGTLVDVGNRVNTPDSFRNDRVIHRVNPHWQLGRVFPLSPSLDAVP